MSRRKVDITVQDAVVLGDVSSESQHITVVAGTIVPIMQCKSLPDASVKSAVQTTTWHPVSFRAK